MALAGAIGMPYSEKTLKSKSDETNGERMQFELT